MKTAIFTHPTYHVIDTAPLAARYEVLAQAVLAFVMAGRLGLALRASRKIVRLVRTLSKLEAQNVHLTRKLDMLSHRPWRERVLRELGGMQKFKLWEAAKARIEARAAAPAAPPKPQEPAWLYTAERIAESERLKARKREIFRAGHNALIVRDRYKVDFEGEFRLAPLPRGERAARQMKVYTANTILDYDWNPMPFQEEKGFGPACVWPAEFYAAMEVEARILEEEHVNLFSVIPHEDLGRSPEDENGGSISKDGSLGLDPPSASLRSLCGMTKEEDLDDSKEHSFLRSIPLRLALPRATYRDLFENPV